jgi:Set1/Ash2 histone methyltransferase complex subunit ASH2
MAAGGDAAASAGAVEAVENVRVPAAGSPPASGDHLVHGAWSANETVDDGVVDDGRREAADGKREGDGTGEAEREEAATGAVAGAVSPPAGHADPSGPGPDSREGVGVDGNERRGSSSSDDEGDVPGGERPGAGRARAPLEQRRLTGAGGSCPTWKESAIAVWRELAAGLAPDRFAFTLRELTDYTERHWATFCWNRSCNDQWFKVLQANFRYAALNGTRCFIDVGGGNYMLSADVGQDPGLNEYVSEEKCRQLAALSSRKRAEAAALKRAADAAALKRAAEAGDAERGNDREWKRRRSRRPLTIAGEVEASAVPAEGSGVALAKIPAEWLTVPDGPVRLSTVDRAPGLTTLEDSLTVHGFKGYRMVRATHGVCEGDWYFEATVLPAEVVGRTPSAVRLGWSTRRADVETPVASDENGYGVRDINGHFIHEARLMAYGEPFGAGDVVGCRIVLPAPVSDETRAKIAAADKDWLYFRFVSYLQGKPPSNAGERVDGAYVEFFKNGASQGIPQYFCKDEGARKAREASTGMAAGMYFPSVALFKNAAVRANFGPDFAHAPRS